MKKAVFFAVSVITLFLLSYVVIAVPSGAGVNVLSSETWTNASAGSYGGQGGNVTNLSLCGCTQTNAWAGFFGEVSGGITLNDAGADIFYDWAVSSVTGEVYASRDSAPTWTSVVAVDPCTTDELFTGTGSDKVSNTFTALNNSALTVGTTVIGAGTSCALANGTYVNDAEPTSPVFEEILISDGTDPIYVAKINENTVGFDGDTHDYQMIVPDNYTSNILTYYFFIELG